MRNMFKNQEHYSDPTAGQAIVNAIWGTHAISEAEQERLTEIKHRPMVYIASPYAGNTAANTRAAIGYCAYAISQNKIPVASHLMYPAVLSDKVASERELGTMFGLALLAACDEVWICGSCISPGMQAEIAEAKLTNKPIRRIGKEVLQ